METPARKPLVAFTDEYMETVRNLRNLRAFAGVNDNQLADRAEEMASLMDGWTNLECLVALTWHIEQLVKRINEHRKAKDN
jgi:hypothetical protein